MSTSFQSECVYCDSRLYASTVSCKLLNIPESFEYNYSPANTDNSNQIIACTGQPILANNVTQAQAFCIATACLQVPVLQMGDSLKVAQNQLNEQSSSLSSSSQFSLLFKPSLLLKGSDGLRDKDHKWDGFNLAMRKKGTAEQLGEPHLNSEHRRPIRSLSIEERNSVNLDTLNRGQLLDRFKLMVEPRPSTIGNRMMQSSALENASGELANSTAPKGEPAATNQAPSGAPETPKPNVMTSEETRPAQMSSAPTSYPNFNQAYAKIYNNLNQQYRPSWLPVSPASQVLFWRPVDYGHMSLMDHIRTQQASKLHLTAQRVAHMMQSVSNGFAMKRSSLRNKWQSMSSRYSPIPLHQPASSGYFDRWRHVIYRNPVAVHQTIQGYDLPSRQPILSGSSLDTELMDP